MAEFRSLVSMLYARAIEVEDVPADDPAAGAAQPGNDGAADALECATGDLLRDVRLFHARVHEAVETAAESLTAELALTVLGRELELRPADIRAIVRRILRRYAAEQPLRVRAHPDDAAGLACELPVTADESLRRGDAVVELRAGSLDASLTTRLDWVLGRE